MYCILYLAVRTISNARTQPRRVLAKSSGVTSRRPDITWDGRRETALRFGAKVWGLERDGGEAGEEQEKSGSADGPSSLTKRLGATERCVRANGNAGAQRA